MRVFYTPDRPTAGNVVTLHATVLDPNGTPLNGVHVKAELRDPAGEVQRLRFQPVGDEWGLYTSRFSPPRVGTYQLRLTCQETAAVLETSIEVQGQPREMIGKPARYDVLREIAEITRGRVLAADQLNRLCDLVLQLPPPEPVIRRKQIWASPYWAGTLVACLGAFWVGRKMSGAV